MEQVYALSEKSAIDLQLMNQLLDMVLTILV